jgi:branched-chain amino acid transport system substrate-binding protein
MKKHLALILAFSLFLSACSQQQIAPEVDIVVEAPPISDPTDPPPPTPTPKPTLPPTPKAASLPIPTFSPETITILAGEPVKIAYLLWDVNPAGQDSVRGVEIALADFGPELLGHPIQLSGLNSECNEFAGQQGAIKLMQDKNLIGVIGTTCSVPALKAAEVISENNRVLISPSSTNPELTDPETHLPGFSRTAPNDLAQIQAVAHHAFDKLGARRMAIVRGEVNPFQRLYAQALCGYFTDLGGECVLEFAKYAGDTYVTPIINELVEVETDAIYFLGWDFEEASAFLEAVQGSDELSDTAVYLWGEVYNNPQLLDEAGDTALGVYVSATSYDIIVDERYQVFLATYQERYGEDPQSVYHPYAYDAVTLLLTAISQVAVPGDDGSLMVDPLAVRDAIYNQVEFQGLAGFINCSPTGDCLSSAEGKIYQFTSGDPATYNPGPPDLPGANPIQVWP